MAMRRSVYGNTVMESDRHGTMLTIEGQSRFFPALSRGPLGACDSADGLGQHRPRRKAPRLQTAMEVFGFGARSDSHHTVARVFARDGSCIRTTCLTGKRSMRHVACTLLWARPWMKTIRTCRRSANTPARCTRCWVAARRLMATRRRSPAIRVRRWTRIAAAKVPRLRRDDADGRTTTALG
jgi:hypothetical protein